jgi:beta-lactam-binding protein with PASTA domain
MKRHQFGTGFLCACLLLVLAGCSKVPDLTGMTREEVDETLKSKKLKAGAVRTAKQGKTAATVVDQDPKPGAKIPDDKTIALVFEPGAGVAGTADPKTDTGNSGAADPPLTTSTVPVLIGKTQAEAEQTIDAGGLMRGTIDVVVNDQPEGKVFFQDPPASTQVKRGTLVNLKIASSATVKVPKVIGLSQNDADAALRNAQLTLGDVTPVVVTVGGPVGSIVLQNPNADLQVARGTPVAVNVKQDSTTVPAVLEMNSTLAQNALFRAGLQPAQTSRYDPNLAPALEGTISQQTVVPGTLVAKGSVVGIVMRTRIRSRFTDVWTKVDRNLGFQPIGGANAVKLWRKPE